MMYTNYRDSGHRVVGDWVALVPANEARKQQIKLREIFTHFCLHK